MSDNNIPMAAAEVKRLKVLLVHISDYHRGGGGGVSMYRLHRSLQSAGVDSRILCGTKTLSSPDITQIPRLPKLERLLKVPTSNLGLNDIHLVNSFRVKNLEVYRQADILDFHGIHGGRTLSYLSLPMLTREKPAVFTMHDMWAFTGHCAYSYDCDRWQIGCGQCPYLDTHPAVKRDNTHLEWKLKNWVYEYSNLTIVTVSNWLAKLARQSMLQRFPIHYIPNGIDTETYKPLDPEKCRALLDIPLNKRVLMFGALSLSNHRKGGDLLLKALQSLPVALQKELVLLTIGRGGEELFKIDNIQTINLGFVTQARFKAICYSAADLFIHPTRADNLPLMLLESMACGTPMVSFDVGGVPELVRPGITGYLAKYEDADDLCRGIIQLLENDSVRRSMREHCRSIVLREYTLKLQTQRYLEVYHRLLHNSASQPVEERDSSTNLVPGENESETKSSYSVS